MKIFMKLLENCKTPQRQSLILFLSPLTIYTPIYIYMYKVILFLYDTQRYYMSFPYPYVYTLQNFCSNTKLLLIFSNFSVCASLCFALYIPIQVFILIGICSAIVNNFYDVILYLNLSLYI